MRLNKQSFYRNAPGLIIVISVLIGIMTGLQSIAYLSIFYWSIFRSDLVPISLLVGVGLIYDSINGHYLGESTTIYLLIMGIIYIDRRFLVHRDFNYLWQSISALICVIGLGQFFLTSQLGLMFSMQHQLLDVMLGIGLFPFFVKLMAPILNRLSSA